MQTKKKFSMAENRTKKDHYYEQKAILVQLQELTKNIKKIERKISKIEKKLENS